MLLERPETHRRAPRELDELWAAYRSEPSVELRNRLTLHYAPLAKFVAFRVLASAPSHVDGADLASYGLIGLIDAIERFDPSRQIRFEAYATRRIRGAIIDELRQLDWTPRSVRRKAKAIDRAAEHLEGSLRRTPDATEVAAQAGMSPAEYRATVRDIERAAVAALDAPARTDEDRGAGCEPPADPSSAPDLVVEERLGAESLSQALADATPRDRTVLTLYYFENLTLAEIGAVLGVSEGRACQLHARAMGWLRQRVTALHDAA